MSFERRPNRQERRVRQAAAAAIALTMAVAPLAFLHANRAVFALPQTAINFSWSAILAGGATVATIFVLLNRLSIAGATRRAILAAFAFGVALATTLVVTAYVGSFFSNRAWGDNLTFKIVAEVLSHPFSSLDLIGTPASLKHLVLSLLVLGIVVAVSLLTLLYAFILSELSRASSGSDESRPTSARAIRLGLPLIAAICSGVCIQIAVTKPHRLLGEPLTSFLGFSSASNLVHYDSERVLAALQDHEARVSYRVPANFRKKNVILIFSDAVRADRLKPYGYDRATTPFLSSLFASGRATKVEMALSPCPDPFCGISTTLSARHYHQVSNENFKLNEVLKKAGYQVSYFLSGEHKSWRFLWDFYGNDVDRLINVPFTDDQEPIEQFKRQQLDPHKQHFMYFFLMSTHVLGKKLPEFERFRPAHFSVDLLWRLVYQRPSSFDEHGVALYPPLQSDHRVGLSNRYDNGVLQVDAMIQEIFNQLDRSGLLSDSIVVIVADHGEGLGERGHVAHARFLYQKDIRVPLIIYDGELSTYQNREFATLLDVAPTIVDRLGLPLPETWQGVPLTRPSGSRTSLHQTRWREKPCAAVVRKDKGSLRKYIRCRWEGRADSEEIFDLAADPDELLNIVGSVSGEELRAFRSQTAPRLRRIVCPGKGDVCG